jgi:RNA polymerase sigma factor (sigma-70 family)
MAEEMPTPSSTLQSVVDRLPFAIDDTDAANEAFRRWKQQGRKEERRTVDLWTYCYVSRYFLSKSARKTTFANASDADELTTRAFQKVQRSRDSVRNHDRYASWVSVICKNVLLNYLRRDRYAESIQDEDGPTLTAQARRSVADVGFVHEALTDAIDELPNYLQEPARLYFLENLGFSEISEAIGKPVATVRTYKHKAVKQLRTNERLQEYVHRSDL